MEEDRIVTNGVELLAHLEHGELSLADAMDRIELVTDNPRLQRAIIDAAEARGVIERDGKTIRPTSHEFLRFEADVRTKQGEFTCKRCGAEIGTGYFIQLDSGELGPFGSSCIRKVTGRE